MHTRTCVYQGGGVFLENSANVLNDWFDYLQWILTFLLVHNGFQSNHLNFYVNIFTSFRRVTEGAKFKAWRFDASETKQRHVMAIAPQQITILILFVVYLSSCGDLLKLNLLFA